MQMVKQFEAINIIKNITVKALIKQYNSNNQAIKYK